MSDIDPFNPITHLDSSPKSATSWIGYFAKPAVMLICAIILGYVTMWLNTNFVKQDKFAVYVDKQIENDKRQDEILKNRFEITQTKLETIINQQVSYTEQLKAYNQIMLGIQKQVDNIDERVKFIEREKLAK
jgi:uncharacterized membrane-anchored protein YhcB (DUF1043 family)